MHTLHDQLFYTPYTLLYIHPLHTLYYIQQISFLISDDSNTLLTGQRASLRESLVVLSENTTNTTQRDELLTMALEAVVIQWNALSTQVFQSPNSLLEYIQIHIQQYNINTTTNILTPSTTSSTTLPNTTNSPTNQQQKFMPGTLKPDLNLNNIRAPSLLLTESSYTGSIITQIKSVLNTIMSIAKRVVVPSFDVMIWSEEHIFTITELCGLFPFTTIWKLVIPGLYTAMSVLHELWR